MSRERLIALTVVVLTWLPAPSQAYVQAGGYLIARQPCPALQSIRNGSNPGSVTLTVDMAYPVLGKNRPDATYWHLHIGGAAPQARWVPITCGIHVVRADDGGDTADASSAAPSAANATTGGGCNRDYVLALSWQPAFCQDHPRKNECQTQVPGRYDTAHLTLHGLWPQPPGREYCDVSERDKALDRSGAWAQLPPLALTDATYLQLLQLMPGVASQLQRHEWIKHGSCFGAPAEVYFRAAMALQRQVNRSPIRQLFVDNVGGRLSAAEIRAGFDKAFGPGTGSKVNMRCTGGLVTELWIHLRGEVTPSAPLAALLKHAPDAHAGCREGLVDREGLQSGVRQVR